MLRRSVDRAVAFHPDDAVHDRVCGAHRACDIKDGGLDARPMERVLWPPVDAAGKAPEAVLEGQGRSSPVMRLHLGHRDDDIGGADSVWEPHRSRAREPTSES